MPLGGDGPNLQHGFWPPEVGSGEPATTDRASLSPDEAFTRFVPSKRGLMPIGCAGAIALVGMLSVTERAIADHALLFDMTRLRCENFAGWQLDDNGTIEPVALDGGAITVDLKGRHLYLIWTRSRSRIRLSEIVPSSL